MLVLTHELEHVRIIVEDLEFHRFTSWMYNVFKENRLECKLTPYELPWERHCYEMGKLVAIKVCREVDFYEKFAEYAAILKKYNSNHAEVVEWLQKVDCSETVNEVDWLDTLKRKTRQFCQEQKKAITVNEKLINKVKLAVKAGRVVFLNTSSTMHFLFCLTRNIDYGRFGALIIRS